ncbi:sulfatase [Flavobacterium sp. 7A]|uniref:sulfatase n=1 Tax=Flavobacterium sp. 7A TaxID=2940571 RepID=UPI0022270C38|nr:sulfatase [Flavobacterium sp. 7A]MCW2118810.1 arylsulfatase A-like enzyme [Flavobacterium sp. 7A]
MKKRTIKGSDFLMLFLIIIGNISISNGQKQPNVVFIMVDDLRPELGCYGSPQIKTPNIDKLASQGTLFNNAYCNIPVCGASRASLLTGILPTKERFVQFDAYASKDVPDAKTLPQVFKEAGYQTFSIGKVFHHPDDANDRSWSEPAWLNQGEKYDFMLSKDPISALTLSKANRGRIYEMPDVKDDAYNDGQTALKTIEQLRNQKKNKQPFFIACGFVRPHLPFYAPKKYWDLYNRDSITEANNNFRPKNAPASLNGSGEFRNYYLDNLNPKSEEFRKMMKHGYYASVSYTDKLIGDVLQELKNLNLDENTIVVLWGDHGWNLGEHTFWGKHNMMKLALKVPLIIKVPTNKNVNKTSAIVESADIFPTLCSLAGIIPPKQIQGKSFTELLSKKEEPFREYAYSRFLDGDTVINDRYAYTHYSGKKHGEEVMLFDHLSDPDENENVVMKPEYKEVVKEMEAWLKASQNRAVK